MIREASKTYDYGYDDQITVNEQPPDVIALRIRKRKPVQSCFEKRVRLVQFLGELLEFKLNWIDRYKGWRLKCTHKYDKEAQISSIVVRGNMYPKYTRKTRPFEVQAHD